MNTNILKKCLEELKADKPRIDYVCGMLETLIEISEPESIESLKKGALMEVKNIMRSDAMNTTDEAAVMEARAKAALATVKAMSDASNHT